MAEDDDFLSVPVKITADDGKELTLVAINTVENCPKCAVGQGCGQNPWFRGLFKNHAIQVLRPENFITGQKYAELTLSIRVLNQLTIMTYGVPLLSFILMLTLTQMFAPWQQFIFAFSGLSLSIWLSKYMLSCMLQKKLGIRSVAATGIVKYP